jgi:hypothetical protein
LVLLIALCLVFSTASKCTKDPPPPPPPSPSVSVPPTLSDTDLVTRLGDRARSWLTQTLGAFDLTCPNQSSNAAIVSTAPDTARACLITVNGGFVLRVQNRTAAPLTLLFSNLNSRTVVAGSVLDVPVNDPQFDQYVTFESNVWATATIALISGLLEHASPSYAWRSCVTNVTVACLTSNLAPHLPQVVKIGDFDVPLRRIVNVFSNVLQYAPLVSTITQQSHVIQTGRLTIRQR